MKSCFFIGHREASSEVFPALFGVVEQHIVEHGVTEFIVGNYGGFDHRNRSVPRIHIFQHLYPTPAHYGCYQHDAVAKAQCSNNFINTKRTDSPIRNCISESVLFWILLNW